MCVLFQVNGFSEFLSIVNMCLDDLFFVCTCSNCVMCQMDRCSRNLAVASNSRCQKVDLKHFHTDDAQL